MGTSPLQVKRTREANTTHGCRNTKVYRVWSGMLDRCRNPNGKDYQRYGARGIRVCESWYRFENFLRDMGAPPSGLMLERKDNGGNYCKENCVWATAKTQARNRRNNTLVAHQGKLLTIVEWAEELGFPRYTISKRLRRGWSVERTLGTPPMQQFNRYKRGEEPK